MQEDGSHDDIQRVAERCSYGSQVRVHPYGNQTVSPHKSGNNVHVHKQDSAGRQLNDRGQVSTNPNNTHIGVPDQSPIRPACFRHLPVAFRWKSSLYLTADSYCAGPTSPSASNGRRTLNYLAIQMASSFPFMLERQAKGLRCWMRWPTSLRSELERQ